MNARRLTLWIVIGLILAGSLSVLFWPRAIPVDLATITRGPLSVTVDDEGKTRVRDVYVVSAPVAGQARRIATEVGDEVTGGVTVLTTIEPSDPTFLDRRSRSQAEARAKAVEAALSLAAAERDRAKAELDFAEAELKRARELAIKKPFRKARLTALCWTREPARRRWPRRVRRCRYEVLSWKLRGRRLLKLASRRTMCPPVHFVAPP